MACEEWLSMISIILWIKYARGLMTNMVDDVKILLSFWSLFLSLISSFVLLQMTLIGKNNCG